MIPVSNYNCTNSPSHPHSNAMIIMLKCNWCACGNTKHCNWCAPNNTTMPLRRQWTLPNICRRCISRSVPLSCNRNSLAPLIKGLKRAAVPQTELALLQAGGAHNYAHDYIAHEEHLHTERWRAYFEETISCILIQSLSILSILILLALEVESCTVREDETQLAHSTEMWAAARESSGFVLKILHICGFVVNNLHICGLCGVIVKWQRGHWESPETVAEGDSDSWYVQKWCHLSFAYS